MRTEKEILKLMLNNTDVMAYGLCQLASNLTDKNLMTEDELILIVSFIGNNKPKNKRTRQNRLYYWVPFSKKPRINWIKKHIAKLESKNV